MLLLAFWVGGGGGVDSEESAAIGFISDKLKERVGCKGLRGARAAPRCSSSSTVPPVGGDENYIVF